jgi:hypothetical protein
MEWYIRKGVPLNILHFLNRAIETKDWSEMDINKNQILDLLSAKIHSVSFNAVKDDVEAIKHSDSMSIGLTVGELQRRS